jgi:hypothetical protein
MKKRGKKKKNVRRSFPKYNAFEIKFFSLNCFALLRQFSLSGSDCSMRINLRMSLRLFREMPGINS